VNYTHYSKRALIVEIEERDQKIKILELKVKFLQARVIGKSAKSLPPPAPVATTNREFWGLMKEEQEKLVSKEPIFRGSTADYIVFDDVVAEELQPLEAQPPIKCTNCEE